MWSCEGLLIVSFYFFLPFHFFYMRWSMLLWMRVSRITLLILFYTSVFFLLRQKSSRVYIAMYASYQMPMRICRFYYYFIFVYALCAVFLFCIANIINGVQKRRNAQKAERLKEIYSESTRAHFNNMQRNVCVSSIWSFLYVVFKYFISCFFFLFYFCCRIFIWAVFVLLPVRLLWWI